MEAWATFWGWVLVLVFAIFALLALVITIGGFFDVKALLSIMLSQQEEEDEVTR